MGEVCCYCEKRQKVHTVGFNDRMNIEIRRLENEKRNKKKNQTYGVEYQLRVNLKKGVKREEVGKAPPAR